MARDLFTDDDGTAAVLATAEMHVVTDYTLGTLVRELTMTPAVDGLDALIGARAGGGFRKVLDLETDAERGSLPYLLLDDVPGATLVSGVAMTTAADRGDAELEEFRERMRSQGRACRSPISARAGRPMAPCSTTSSTAVRRCSSVRWRRPCSTTTIPTPGTTITPLPGDRPAAPAGSTCGATTSCTSTCSSATA